MFFERYDPLKQEMVGILAPDGSCNETLRPALDEQQVRQLYRQMWLLRLYDRKAVSLQRQGRFGTYAQMEGQEACMVASVLPLQPQDFAQSLYPLLVPGTTLLVTDAPVLEENSGPKLTVISSGNPN